MSAADRLRFWIVTGGGTGLAPLAPGTFGTLPGVGLAMLLGALLSDVALAAALGSAAIVLLAFGCAQTKYTERAFPNKDPGQFVLDEIVGYLVAAALFTALVAELSPRGHGLCFLAFRFFDILKPPPAGRLEEIDGAPGIMLDDVAAGVYAGLVLVVASRLGWF